MASLPHRSSAIPLCRFSASSSPGLLYPFSGGGAQHPNFEKTLQVFLLTQGCDPALCPSRHGAHVRPASAAPSTSLPSLQAPPLCPSGCKSYTALEDTVQCSHPKSFPWFHHPRSRLAAMELQGIFTPLRGCMRATSGWVCMGETASYHETVPWLHCGATI